MLTLSAMRRQNPDLPSVENFITTWQTSDTALEVAEKLGMRPNEARAQAAKLRKAGVELQRYRPGGARLRLDLPVVTPSEAEKKGYVSAQQAGELINVTPETISQIASDGNLKLVGRLPGRASVLLYLLRERDVLEYRRTHVRSGWNIRHKTPRNGQFFKAMLVGAPSSLARKIRTFYADYGVAILWHYEYKDVHLSVGKPIPGDCELIIIAKDMVGHGVDQLWMQRANQANTMGKNIGCVRVLCRKKSSMTAMLRTHGYLIPYQVKLDDAGDLAKVEVISEPASEEKAAALDTAVQQILEATEPATTAKWTATPAPSPIEEKKMHPAEARWSIDQTGALGAVLAAIRQAGIHAVAARIKAIFIDVPKNEVHVEYIS